MIRLRVSCVAAALLPLLVACGGEDEGSSPDANAGASAGGSGGSTSGGSGGGTSGGSGGDTSGSGGTSDAGTGGTAGEAGTTGSGGSGGSGGASDGPGVPISFEDCEAFEPCGGELDGIWEYSATCLGPTLVTEIEASVQPLCPEATVSAEGTIDGTIAFNGSRVVRVGDAEITVTLVFPDSCLTTAGIDCATMQLMVQTGGAPNASCESGGGACTCVVVESGDSFGEQGYTVEGTTLTLEDGRTFEYCVDGTALTYQETGEAAEPGVYELTVR